MPGMLRVQKSCSGASRLASSLVMDARYCKDAYVLLQGMYLQFAIYGYFLPAHPSSRGADGETCGMFCKVASPSAPMGWHRCTCSSDAPNVW